MIFISAPSINAMQLRRGREFYGKKYDEAMRLYDQGKSVTEIAKHLGISYSAAYHWVKGLRKPESGNVNDFCTFLEKNGPAASVHVMSKFPKHNELFLMASRRGLPLKRVYLGRKYKELGTWYYVAGQEKRLEERVQELEKKIKGMKEKLKEAAFRSV